MGADADDTGGSGKGADYLFAPVTYSAVSGDFASVTTPMGFTYAMTPMATVYNTEVTGVPSPTVEDILDTTRELVNLNEQNAEDSLSGAGAGLRWFWKQYLYASLDVAQALQDGVTTRRRDIRAHYQLFCNSKSQEHPLWTVPPAMVSAGPI